MPDIFDKFGSFLKSIFSEGEENTEGHRRYQDPDMQDAWNELEEYLNEGTQKSRAQPRREEKLRSEQKPRRRQERERLREDYANLKVPLGASFEEVRTAYKKLLRQYHPDRHASDPQKFKLATEITSKINQSFQRIEEYEKNLK
jgi:DNA segregation ATPase FtsK/SpoIIIE-like protein